MKTRQISSYSRKEVIMQDNTIYPRRKWFSRLGERPHLSRQRPVNVPVSISPSAAGSHTGDRHFFLKIGKTEYSVWLTAAEWAQFVGACNENAPGNA